MKRAFDIVAAMLLFTSLLPVILVAALAVKLTSRGPIFYRQRRIGQNFRPFRIFKLRTMYVNDKRTAITLHKDERITPVGSILRRYHIDEFPQLLDVIRGRMSMIGPRPMIMEHLQSHQDQWSQILSHSKPGITGLGSILYAEREYQLLARSQNPQECYQTIIQRHKIRLELFYIQKRGIWLDIKIIWWTFKKFMGWKR